MKYFSMFTGVGGFELGIQQAYESYIKYAPIGKKPEQEKCQQGRIRTTNKQSIQLLSGSKSAPLCVGFSEIDKYSNQLLQIKFPTVKNYGDATKINPTKLPDFDLLVGGFPCQSFSIAGKRKGFDDTRGTLFFDIARILANKKPSLVVLENVKGLLSHDGGRTFQTIIGVLTDLGYFVEWQVLNSKNFGVPQNRERVFIIGHLGGQPRQKVFPVTDSNSEDIVLPTITTRIETLSNGTYVGKRQTQKAKSSRQGLQKERFESDNPDSRGGQTYTPNIRRLTPLETERLQGFPDGWTKDFSDTQRYKMMGNAVTTTVVQHIVERLLYKNYHRFKS